MLPATISWLAALTVWPAPLAPTCTMVLPTVSRIGLAAAKSSSEPPTMIDNVAFLAPGSPPDTGASMIRSPRSAPILANSAVTSRPDRGEVDHEGARLSMGEDPVISQQNALHLRGVRHHDRHDVGVLDRLLDGFAGLASRFDHARRCAPATVSSR